MERKTARYADLITALSNEGWNCSLYMIEVGAQGHILKSIKDRLWSLFRVWVPAGHRSGIGQMKDVSRILCVHFPYSRRARPCLVFSLSCHPTHRWGSDGCVNRGSFWTPVSTYPRKKKGKLDSKALKSSVPYAPSQ
jgi:hypothetical protein